MSTSLRQLRKRLRVRLGVPAAGSRTWLLLIFAFVGLVVGIALLADVLLKFGQYGPPGYEPKDFQREEQVTREAAKPPASR